jgi:septum formation protein
VADPAASSGATGPNGAGESVRAPIVLASGSPRRRELLEQLGLAFEIRAADIDESVLDGEAPLDYVQRLSIEKAAAVVVPTGSLVIAADTTVDVDGRILGKPADVAEARSMLSSISGRLHQVHTGVTLRLDDRSVTAAVSTEVEVALIDEATMAWYVATGEPFDKAGGYALQGAGGVFVAGVRGSVSNVIGLPLATVVTLARQLGVALL